MAYVEYTIYDLGFNKELDRAIQGDSPLAPPQLSGYNSGLAELTNSAVAPQTIYSGGFGQNLTLASGQANTANINVGSGTNIAGLNSADASTDIAIWAGAAYDDRTTAAFRVTAAGALTATNATLTGSITATTLDIGGSDSTSFHVDANGNLWLGASAYASAPFQVSNAGAATASSFNHVQAVTAGETLTAGKAVYISTDGKGYHAHALNSTITSRFIGMCQTGASSGGTAYLQSVGNFTTSGLTAGNPYYIQDPTTDQSDTGTGANRTITTTQWQGQTFQAGQTLPIVAATLRLRDAGASGAVITAAIRATSGGLPTGSDLVSATVTGLTASYADYNVVFTLPYSLTSGTTYALIARTNVGTPEWEADGANSYGNGSVVTSTNSGSTWAADATDDMYFKTHYATGNLGTSAGTVSKQVGVSSSTTNLALI